MLAFAELFDVSVSGSLTALTVAVLAITSVPGAAVSLTVNVTVIVARAPAASVPTVQVPSGADVVANVPSLTLTSTTVTPLGSVKSSVNDRPVASVWPAFVTLMR